MAQSFLGKAVSIQCNERLGVFQGTIKDCNNKQITIIRAFRNGVPLRKQDAEVTLSASDIIKLDLIPTYTAQSTVAATVINNPTPVKQPNYIATSNKESALTHKMAKMKLENRRSPTKETRSKRTENKSPLSNLTKSNVIMLPSKVESKLVATLSSSGESGRNFSNPIDIKTSSRSVPINTPLKQEKKKSRREARYNKNQTFGTPIDDPLMDEDFDFEGNLALFDKQAIWNEIESGGQKPDLVKQAVSAQCKSYRHDENVLISDPTQLKQIESIYNSTQEFVTDQGLLIPAIPQVQRNQIQRKAIKNGLTWERQMDMLARGTSDLAIILLGGARRLTPHNEHQWPTIVIICDSPLIATPSIEIAAATGRQLTSHGLKVILYIKPQGVNELENNEVKLFNSSDCLSKVVSSVQDLPSSDLVILSLNTESLSSPIKNYLSYNRASILAIDPPPSGIRDITIKCSIIPILPLNETSVSCGKLYLCNLSIPNDYFSDSGIKYKSPFGHKFVIPIHMKD